jgi:hypothetical protein
VKRDDLPLLFASAEHRAWIVGTEAFLKGERASPPPLDLHQCRFGKWLDTESLTGYGTQPAFQALEPLHRLVHAMTAELLALHGEGRQPQALTRLGELHGMRDALLAQVKLVLRESRA